MTIMRQLPSVRLPTFVAIAAMAFASQMANPVWAASSNAAAQQQADQISRTLSQQARDRQQQMQRDLTRAPNDQAPAAPKASEPQTRETCIPVRSISVSGAKVIAQRDIKQTTTAWQGKCLGLTELNNVLQALTYLYIQRGYVAARAYLPQQDLSDGSLEINIVEGRLTDVLLKDGHGTQGQLQTAFPGLKDKPVNLRDIEQGLDQINRLSSNKATIALAAGKAQGDSVLGVKIDKARPWSASISSDNLGSPSTGIYQSHLNFGLDSPLGLNDQWQFSYQRSMDRSPVFFSSKDPNSDTVTGSFSIPYGYLTAGIDTSWSQYHASVQGQISSIDTSGRSLSISPYLTWLLSRDQISKTWVTGRLTWKSNDNFILGSRIDVSSRILSIASVELGHSRQFLGGTLSANVGYEQGLRGLGAFNDATAPAGSPKGQFGKGTASLGYSRANDIGPVTAIFSTSLSGQWSRDQLFASEQMALGSISTVPGTRDTVLSGSNAFFIRNELSVLMPAFEQPELASAVGRIEPYINVGFGRSIANANDGSLGGNITGGAIGIRNRGADLNFDVSWARVFSVSPLPSGVSLPVGIIQARMSASF